MGIYTIYLRGGASFIIRADATNLFLEFEKYRDDRERRDLPAQRYLGGAGWVIDLEEVVAITSPQAQGK
jgi:hypothetical protein